MKKKQKYNKLVFCNILLFLIHLRSFLLIFCFKFFWELQFFERRTLFFQKIYIYSFAKWRTCYCVTVCEGIHATKIQTLASGLHELPIHGSKAEGEERRERRCVCWRSHSRERTWKSEPGGGGGDFLETLAMIVVGPRPYMNTTFPGG